MYCHITNYQCLIIAKNIEVTVSEEATLQIGLDDMFVLLIFQLFLYLDYVLLVLLYKLLFSYVR